MGSSSQRVTWDSDFESSQSELENDTRQPPRKKRIHSDWEFVRQFSSKEEDVNFIKNEKSYKFNNSYKTNESETLKYVCKVDRNCGSRIRIQLLQKSTNVTVEKTQSDHDHSHKPAHGIPVEVREEIIALLHQSVSKPNAILKSLSQKGIAPPGKAQLNRFLLKHHKKEAPPILSLGALENACVEYVSILDDPDASYIVHSEFDYEAKWFGICMSTKRLLDLSKQSPGVQADATYKNSWGGFPVLITGTTDMNKVFHPTLIALTTGETTRDYAFLFEALKKGMGQDFSPKILLADCADAITNGFAKVFGRAFVRAHCSFHVMKNVDQKSNLVKDKSVWNILRRELTELQLARNGREFRAAAELWSRKYNNNPITSDFHNYFYAEYLVRYTGWYEGLFVGFPSTNNGLEATNRWIKSQGTLRNRLPMAKMILFLLEQANTWSNERNFNNPNCKMYASQQNILLKMSKSAFEWVQKKPDMRLKTDARNKDLVIYYISASGKPQLKDADVTRYLGMKERCSWRSLESYLSGISRLWMVVFNKSDWKDSSCTCPVFLKSNTCKHLVGIASKLGLFEFPPAAKEIPLGVKRKRGRIPHASRALIVD